MAARRIPYLLALTCAVFASASNAIVIDNFNVGSGSVFTTGTVPPAISALNIAGASGVIGGSRTINITAATGPAVFSAVNTAPNTGQYNHSNPSGTSGTSTVFWDADGAGLAGGGATGEDLTDGGTDDALQLDVVKIDLGSITVTFTVTSPNGDSSELTITNLALGQQAFFFSDFNTVSGGGADFMNVDSIELEVIAGNDIDVRLDLIQTRTGVFNVPLPGTLALMLVALAGLHGGRRRIAQGRQQRLPA